jgi:hypothetical protein
MIVNRLEMRKVIARILAKLTRQRGIQFEENS